MLRFAFDREHYVDNMEKYVHIHTHTHTHTCHFYIIRLKRLNSGKTSIKT